MSNMRPFASTPAAHTKDTVIWSFNGQSWSFYNLTWINVRRSQKNSMLFFIQNVFYTWKYDKLFPSVKNILNKEKSTAMQRADNVMSIFRSWACLSLWDLIGCLRRLHCSMASSRHRLQEGMEGVIVRNV